MVPIEQTAKKIISLWLLYVIFWFIFQLWVMVFSKVSLILFVEIVLSLAAIIAGLIIIGIIGYFVGTKNEYPWEDAINDVSGVIRWTIAGILLLFIAPVIVIIFTGLMFVPEQAGLS